MNPTALHYKIHYLADIVWELAKSLEDEAYATYTRDGTIADRELERRLKDICGQLHDAAPKLPADVETGPTGPDGVR